MYGLAITPKAPATSNKTSRKLTKIAEKTHVQMAHRRRRTKCHQRHRRLHLRLLLEKLSNRGLHVTLSRPRSLSRNGGNSRLRGIIVQEQSGGAGRSASLPRVEPLPVRFSPRKTKAGSGIEIVNEVFGAPSRQFIPAVEKGIMTCSDQGMSGLPAARCLRRHPDGKHHPVDSKKLRSAPAADGI